MNTRKKKGPEVAVKKTDGKKFVRYDEGAKLYSVGKHTFERIAKEAHMQNLNACLKIKKQLQKRSKNSMTMKRKKNISKR